MMSKRAFLLLFCIGFAACTSRNDAAGGDAGVSTDGPGAIDGLTLTDGTSGGDGATGPTCAGIPTKGSTLKSHQSGDWVAAIEPNATLTPVSIANAAANQTGAVVDYEQKSARYAGFVGTIPKGAGDDFLQLVEQAKGRISAALPGVKIIANGGQTTSHDGFVALRGIRAEIDVTGGNISQLRLGALAAVIDKQEQEISGAPKPMSGTSNGFSLRLSAIARIDRVVFIGAITQRETPQIANAPAEQLADDFASDVTIGLASTTTQPVCDQQTLTATPLNKVDIIWVIDESGSMQTEREAVAAGAAAFFKHAGDLGLDFRMGVTNVVSPTGSYSAAVGKFCSKISTNPNDMGGDDRFLLPTEQAIFESCVKNPPGYEGGSEHGLVNAKKAVENHLPRAANDPAKIRNGAKVVIIVMSDEVPQTAATILANNFKQCTLPTDVQTALDAFLQPDIDYYHGKTDPEAALDFFHVIGGTCTSKCSNTPDVAHGYLDLAKAFNGELWDLCASDIAASVRKMLDQMVQGASPYVLPAVPIPATLQIVVGGKVLERGGEEGFFHTAGTKSVGFGAKVLLKTGTPIVASYQAWKQP